MIRRHPTLKQVNYITSSPAFVEIKYCDGTSDVMVRNSAEYIEFCVTCLDPTVTKANIEHLPGGIVEVHLWGDDVEESIRYIASHDDIFRPVSRTPYQYVAGELEAA